MKHTKITISIILIAAMAMGLLSGCGSAPKDMALEPFDMEWGITQEEAAEKLKCAYYTNQKSPGYIYVVNGDNDNALQAFGAVPSMIFYEFNLQKEGSDARRLGKVIYKFSEEDYDQILAALDQKCGKRYFETAMWGTADSDVFLFENGNVCIEYSASPLKDPNTVDADSRDRYKTLSTALYSSAGKTVSMNFDSFFLLWRYSTAETDFVLTDNRQ